MPNAILTLTVNPALDLTTHVARMEPNRKLRGTAPLFDAGGGGVNVSRAIQQLGEDSVAFVAIAGSIGNLHLRILSRTGIPCVFHEMPGETRCNIAVNEDNTGNQYRFTLPGPVQSQTETGTLIDAISAQLAHGFGFVIVSGSLTPGLPNDFYAHICQVARQHGARVILDTSRDALKASLSAHPYLLRIDHIEARELVEGSDMATLSVPEVARRLVEQGSTEIAIITIDDEGAVVASADECVHIRPPKVEVVSAVGAGDSFVGALAVGLSRGWSIVDACRYGVAAAASAVTTEGTRLCSKESTDLYFAETADMVERIL